MLDNYPLGKTPLDVRVKRWAEYIGADPATDKIPIHPDEFWELADSPKFNGRVAGFKVRPIGGLSW